MEVEILGADEFIEFKPWVQQQIKDKLLPIFRANGYKKGRTNCYIRERNGIVQFIQFRLKAEGITVWPGMSPVYFPLDGGSYVGEILPQEESWIYTSGIRARLLRKNGLKFAVTDEVIQKWDLAEKIIIKSIIPRFEKLQNLDELMVHASFVIHDNDIWRGIKWYVEGVYTCLLGNFCAGREMLRGAQKCKNAYIEHLRKIGSEFGRKGDQVAAIYGYIDLFCNALDDSDHDQDIFMNTYLQVCQDSKSWYKV